jgi:hypothetical protein
MEVDFDSDDHDYDGMDFGPVVASTVMDSYHPSILPNGETAQASSSYTPQQSHSMAVNDAGHEDGENVYESEGEEMSESEGDLHSSTSESDQEDMGDDLEDDKEDVEDDMDDEDSDSDSDCEVRERPKFIFLNKYSDYVCLEPSDV